MSIYFRDFILENCSSLQAIQYELDNERHIRVEQLVTSAPKEDIKLFLHKKAKQSS